MDSDLQKQVTAMRSNGMEIDFPSIVPARDIRINQVVFVPVPGKSTTNVFVRILGFPLPPYGFQVAGEIPYEEVGFENSPLVVRETNGKLEVINVLERLIGPGAEVARRAEEEMSLERDE